MFLPGSEVLGLELKTPNESEGDRGDGALHGHSGTWRAVTYRGRQFHIMSPCSQFHVLAGVRWGHGLE